MASERASRRSSGGGGSTRTIVTRLVAILIVLAAVGFAIQGGEFSTLDLWRQARQIKRLTKSIDSLNGVVRGLQAYEDSVEHDPATQERIAREVFGMVRGNKEIIYRFTESPDSAPKKP